MIKKYILALFLLLNTFTFAGWEIRNFEDEFGDPVEERYAITNSIDNQSDFRISKYESSYLVSFFFEKHIFDDLTLGKQGEKLKVRYKIDNLTPVTTQGFVWEEEAGLEFKVDSDFVKKLKKGKMLKVIVEKSNGQKILSKYDLNGFAKIFLDIFE